MFNSLVRVTRIACGCAMAALAFISAYPNTVVAQAVNHAVVAPVEVIFPVPAGGRNGGVVGIAGSHIKRVNAGPNGAMIHLAASKAPVRGGWWFPNNRHMSLDHAMVGNTQGRIVLEIEAVSPVRTKVSVRWRDKHQQPTGKWSQSSELQFGPNHPTKVVLAIPQPAAGVTEIGGFIVQFAKAGNYEIRRVELARLSQVDVRVEQPGAPTHAGDIKITGQAAAQVQEVTLRLTPEKKDSVAKAVVRQAPVSQGHFTLTLTPGKDLTAGATYDVSAEPRGLADQASPPQRLFVYPKITGKQAPPVTRQGPDLVCDGKPFGFVGVNYTRLMLGLSNHANYELIAHDVMQMKRWDVRVVRLPLNFGLIEPALGVFPNSPKYASILKVHNLDPRFMDQVNYFINLAGQQGIYTIIDWHGSPTNPYRYFMGGQPSDQKAGKPGQAIAYLAPSKTKGVPLDMSNPKDLKALLAADRWTAGHFRGNSNVLGIEIPFNEPHHKFMAVEANWRRITNLCAKAVAKGDPDRLTFTLGPSYDHNNLLPSVTWLPCDRASGAAPHFYLANGPVALRPDAKKFKSPWLARNAKATFGWAFASIMMPMSAVNYPIYNGECGKYGYRELLPNRDPMQAASMMIVAQMVQEYAAGMSGHLEWTLWGHHRVFKPFVKIYQKEFKRFAPVFESGPVDRRWAQVAFIQNPAAGRNGNGYNYACVPFAKLALDLHLEPVAYLTGDQLRYQASAELSVGLEQVVSAAESIHYKALVVDRRYLDPRTLTVIKNLHIPVLYTDQAKDLTDAKLASFLTQAGVKVDTRTPRQIQLIEGPEYLIVYRRLAGESNSKVYPHLHRHGHITLTDETGRQVFAGEAHTLANQGVQVNLPLWHCEIYHIKQS